MNCSPTPISATPPAALKISSVANVARRKLQQSDTDTALMELVKAIAAGDTAAAYRLIAASPTLAIACFEKGATRQDAKPYYLDEIGYYVFTGDTALHVAAASYQRDLAQKLIGAGANVHARNRRGAEPLHAAAVGVPGSRTWNPRAQAAIITQLIAAGADPNAIDNNGVTPLHRAIRTRCAAAVKALIEGGADVRRMNHNGSTPMKLATHNTGRGGTGSQAAKLQQQEILRLLQQHAAR
jgi:ankyrin repeat protein